MTLRLVYECDDCGEELDTKTGDFTEARETLRAQHWATTKNGSDWEHRCPDCKPASGGFKRWMD